MKHKGALTIILILLLAFGSVSKLNAPLVSQHKEASTISVNLTHLYEEFNEEDYDGRLPKDLIVYSDNAEGNMGLKDDSCEMGERVCIHINPIFNNTASTEAWTLKHEMCHVYIDEVLKKPELDAHGPLFQSCMIRIADNGGFQGIW
jgi:hypothetical protein